MTALPLSSSDIIIRKACQRDGEGIYRVIREAFADYKSGSNPTFKETIFDIYQDLEENIVLVIEKDKQIIGSLRLEFKGEDDVYLKRFSILPEFQHQGLGTLLYRRAEEEVIANNGKYIYLHSSLDDQKLVKFYHKLGFQCLKKDNKYGYQRGLWVKRLDGVD